MHISFHQSIFQFPFFFFALVQLLNYCWRSKVSPSCPCNNHPSRYPPAPDIIITPHPKPHPPSLPVTLPPTPAAHHLSLWYLTHVSPLQPPSPSSPRPRSPPSPYQPFSLHICPLIFSALPPLTFTVPRGSRRAPPSPSLSTFWHSMCLWWTSFCVPSAPFPPLPLPSSRPTYSTGVHHTCRRTHAARSCQRAPRTAGALLKSNSRGSVRLPGTGEVPHPLILERGCWRTKYRENNFDLIFLSEFLEKNHLVAVIILNFMFEPVKIEYLWGFGLSYKKDI